MLGNELGPYPSIYLEPTPEFIDFVNANESSIICKISGTGTVYDGKLLRGIVYKSSAGSSCRANFYAKTGLYIVSLVHFWMGYPPPTRLGQVQFLGVKSPIVPADEQVNNYVPSLLGPSPPQGPIPSPTPDQPYNCSQHTHTCVPHPQGSFKNLSGCEEGCS